MSDPDYPSKKQSFAPYAAMIIVAIIIIAIANAISVYYTNVATEVRDHDVILDQQKVVTALAKDYLINTQILNKTMDQLKVNTLYHGQLLSIVQNNSMAISNVTKNLDSLIDSHNQMIKAIEQAAGIHTPTINKNTYVHNTYCTIINTPPACKKHH